MERWESGIGWKERTRRTATFGKLVTTDEDLATRTGVDAALCGEAVPSEVNTNFLGRF